MPNVRLSLLARCVPGFAFLYLAGAADASNVTWLGSTLSNSTASLPTSASYTSNFGIAFTTGASGPFTIGWLDLGLSSSGVTSGAGTLKIALRNTTNSTAYSAAAGTTEYAVDTVSFSAPTIVGTYFTLNLTAAQLPNIMAYAMSASTSYALIVYNASAAFAIQRQSGYAQNTNNAYYTVSNGFTALNTFRNNATYTNATGSYPTLTMSFGTAAPVPAPGAIALLGGAGLGARRRRR